MVRPVWVWVACWSKRWFDRRSACLLGFPSLGKSTLWLHLVVEPTVAAVVNSLGDLAVDFVWLHFPREALRIRRWSVKTVSWPSATSEQSSYIECASSGSANVIISVYHVNSVNTHCWTSTFLWGSGRSEWGALERSEQAHEQSEQVERV